MTAVTRARARRRRHAPRADVNLAELDDHLRQPEPEPVHTIAPREVSLVMVLDRLDEMAKSVEEARAAAITANRRVGDLERERDMLRAGIGGARWVLFGLIGGALLFAKELLDFWRSTH